MLHVLIPSYNCTPWIKRCLESVAMQDAEAKVLVYDDASNDPEYRPLAERLCDDFGFRFVHSDTNTKCPHTLRLGIELLDPADEDVIFLLDGDDFLPHEEVFSRILRVYRNPEVWLTYGNLITYPDDVDHIRASQYPLVTMSDRDFRYESHFFNHPLTFRKFLWDGVSDQDMKDADNNWFTTCYDQVIMIPLLEMAGGRHYRFLDETLYVYNSENPLSEIRRFQGASPKLTDRPKKPRMWR